MSNPVMLAQARRIAKNGTARMIRLSNDLSLTDIADEIKASPTTVLRWERLERVPHGEAAVRWAELIEKLSRGGL